MQPSDDAEVFRQLREGRTLFGDGWRCVDSFEEVDDELESDEEEEYIVMDLGTAMDARTLQTEATYQLIGMDTPMPFLKIGEHIFQGAVAPLIGDEVVFDVVRQEDDPQRPHHRPAHKTTHRVELRGISLTNRGERAPTEKPKPEAGGMRSFFPKRRRRKREPGEMDVDSEEDVPATQTQSQNHSHGQTPFTLADAIGMEAQVPTPPARAAETPAPASTPAAASTPAPSAPSVPPTLAELQPTPEPSSPAPLQILETVTPETGRRGGRPRGSSTRASLPVSNLADLADIHHAGGLGDVRLEISEDATPELLAAVSAIRGRPSGPGTRLSRAQEERLVRGLPAAGPGSRGGRGSRGRGGTPRRGARRGRGAMVHPAGEGLADGFFGTFDGDEDGEGGFGEGFVGDDRYGAPGPSGVHDSDEELREIGDDE